MKARHKQKEQLVSQEHWKNTPKTGIIQKNQFYNWTEVVFLRHMTLMAELRKSNALRQRSSYSCTTESIKLSAIIAGQSSTVDMSYMWHDEHDEHMMNLGLQKEFVWKERLV